MSTCAVQAGDMTEIILNMDGRDGEMNFKCYYMILLLWSLFKKNIDSVPKFFDPELCMYNTHALKQAKKHFNDEPLYYILIL